MRLSSVLVSVFFSLCASACGDRGVHRCPAFDPPFRVDAAHPGVIRVRADLDAQFETARAARGTARATLVGFGRVTFAPDASYAVRVPFPSFVESVRVAIGAQVARGTPLAVLRSADVARLRGELRSAQVAVATDRLNAERARRLVTDGAGSERDAVEASARLMSSEAQLAAVRSALGAAAIGPDGGDRYTLVAPANGRVLSRDIAQGERVTPDDTPAFLVGDPSRLVVRASFPERDAPWLDDERACSFVANAASSERYDGTLTEIRRAVDPTTRSVVATCTPRTTDRRLTAEMVVRVEVPVSDASALTIPRSALLLRRDEHLVFTRTGVGTVARRRVIPGAPLGDAVQIKDGLEEGDEVIIRGALLLDGELDQVL